MTNYNLKPKAEVLPPLEKWESPQKEARKKVLAEVRKRRSITLKSQSTPEPQKS